MVMAEEFLKRPRTASEKLVASNIAKRAKKWLEDV
jgi:hypothetical protein